MHQTPPVPDFVYSILAGVVAEVPGAGQRARVQQHAVIGNVPHAIAPGVAGDTAEVWCDISTVGCFT